MSYLLVIAAFGVALVLLVHFGCELGLHDWRDGPGYPCVLCGEHDELYCDCDACTAKQSKH